MPPSSRKARKRLWPGGAAPCPSTAAPHEEQREPPERDRAGDPLEERRPDDRGEDGRESEERHRQAQRRDLHGADEEQIRGEVEHERGHPPREIGRGGERAHRDGPGQEEEALADTEPRHQRDRLEMRGHLLARDIEARPGKRTREREAKPDHLCGCSAVHPETLPLMARGRMHEVEGTRRPAASRVGGIEGRHPCASVRPFPYWPH